MDSGKSVAELLEKIGDGAKISSQLFENIKDPKTGRSSEPHHAPFNRVFDVDLPLWLWYETKEQSYRRRRFAIAMRGVAQFHPHDLLDDGPFFLAENIVMHRSWSDLGISVLDWKALPQGSIVVDVGGGIGTSAVAVARTNDHLRCIVQDLPTICTEATARWKKEFPEIIETGRLSFTRRYYVRYSGYDLDGISRTAHDFFTPQPVTNASVFVLKHILHDWSDPYCAQILKALRAAATPNTKLVVIDNIVAYACHDPTIESGLNSGYKEAPAPLLPNYGAVNVMPYLLDLALQPIRIAQMMFWLNAQERTIGQLDTLLQSSGWQLASAKRHGSPCNFPEPIVALPV
ncbi:hypothetical protein C0995_016137 [Termitomyces sp. Mi166|nr:hypothetical protein C0995_016137 [Termitomyces sp. Mi166\